ncbi:uncharacterized protein LOC141664668 [Apium graveolens]|uniref:uncharacterized protein LOC141664668 n=1 Tax=Apium graveolens TaxID=4045 RepID=UPI003D7A537C
MELRWNGSPIMLYGDVSLLSHKLSFNQLQALVTHDEVQGLFELISVHDCAQEKEFSLNVSETIMFPSDLPSSINNILREFIKGYASITAPLTDLLCKDSFNWSSLTEVAFTSLKQAMLKALVLCLPDFQLEFVIKTDASNVGIRAVLMQADHPIAYFSKKLDPRLVNSAADALSRQPDTGTSTYTMLLTSRMIPKFLSVLRKENNSLPDFLELHKKYAHGALPPQYSITDDRNPIFLSNFWKKLFELSGTTLKHSKAYHPQTDGQSEDRPSTWYAYLGWADFSYNTSFHCSIQMSPYKALYGREPASLPSYSESSTSIQALDELLHDRDALLRSLNENLRTAQHRMQQKANAHHHELELEVGDKVLVKLQPYHQLSMANRSSNKLAKCYYGPFSILQRIGSVAYRVDLPGDSKIHPVFHISLLKPFRGRDSTPALVLPKESYHNYHISSPVAICATRQVVQGVPQEQVVVHMLCT